MWRERVSRLGPLLLLLLVGQAPSRQRLPAGPARLGRRGRLGRLGGWRGCGEAGEEARGARVLLLPCLRWSGAARRLARAGACKVPPAAATHRGGWGVGCGCAAGRG